MAVVEEEKSPLCHGRDSNQQPQPPVLSALNHDTLPTFTKVLVYQ